MRPSCGCNLYHTTRISWRCTHCKESPAAHPQPQRARSVGAAAAGNQQWCGSTKVPCTPDPSFTCSVTEMPLLPAVLLLLLPL